MDNVKVITLLTELRDYYIEHEDLWDKTTSIEDRMFIYRELNCNVDRIQSMIDTLKEEVRKNNAKSSGKGNLYKGIMDLMSMSKGTIKENNLYGVFEAEGKDCVGYDYMICSFQKGVLPDDLPICKIPKYIDAPSKWISPMRNTAKIKVDIPNLKSLKAEKKLNNEIASRGGDRKSRLVAIKVGDNNYKGFNVDNLIMAREIFGDMAEFYVTDNPLQAMYVKSDIGDGVIMPLNLKNVDFKKFIIPRI